MLKTVVYTGVKNKSSTCLGVRVAWASDMWGRLILPCSCAAFGGFGSIPNCSLHECTTLRGFTVGLVRRMHFVPVPGVRGVFIMLISPCASCAVGRLERVIISEYCKITGSRTTSRSLRMKSLCVRPLVYVFATSLAPHKFSGILSKFTSSSLRLRLVESWPSNFRSIRGPPMRLTVLSRSLGSTLPNQATFHFFLISKTKSIA